MFYNIFKQKDWQHLLPFCRFGPVLIRFETKKIEIHYWQVRIIQNVSNQLLPSCGFGFVMFFLSVYLSSVWFGFAELLMYFLNSYLYVGLVCWFGDVLLELLPFTQFGLDGLLMYFLNFYLLVGLVWEVCRCTSWTLTFLSVWFGLLICWRTSWTPTFLSVWFGLLVCRCTSWTPTFLSVWFGLLVCGCTSWTLTFCRFGLAFWFGDVLLELLPFFAVWFGFLVCGCTSWTLTFLSVWFGFAGLRLYFLNSYLFVGLVRFCWFVVVLLELLPFYRFGLVLLVCGCTSWTCRRPAWWPESTDQTKQK